MHLTGASGFLGGYLQSAAARLGASVTRLGRRPEDEVPLDLSDPRSVERFARIAEATAVTAVMVHCGALASMGACAADPELAQQVNVEATARLAQAYGARFVFVSTDLVFDGERGPYGAADSVKPLSEYGRTKAAAELHVLSQGGTVARLPLLFGPDAQGRGASEMVLEAVRKKRDVTLFSNEFRTPVHAQDAADALFAAAAAAASADGAQAGGGNIVHCAGPTRISRAAFGRQLAEAHGMGVEHLIETATTAAERPRDVSLMGGSGWSLPRDWEAMVRDT